MDKEAKTAPLISFNHHFKFDHQESDEELLVVNTPQKKLSSLETVKEKSTMNENPASSTKPNEETNSLSIKTSGALIIGEMPISLNQQQVDDPNAEFAQPVIRAPIIPYIIMPFTKNSKNIKIKETLVEDTFKENQIENSFLTNIPTDITEPKMDAIEAEKRSETISNASIPREKWSHKTEFLLAIIGFSVDLGNIWRCIDLN